MYFFFELQVLSETFFSQTNIYSGNMKIVKNKVFWGLTLNMLFAPIFMVISENSNAKYVQKFLNKLENKINEL